MPVEEKRRLADEEIDCSGSLDRTREQVTVLYAKLRKMETERSVKSGASSSAWVLAWSATLRPMREIASVSLRLHPSICASRIRPKKKEAAMFCAWVRWDWC